METEIGQYQCLNCEGYRLQLVSYDGIDDENNHQFLLICQDCGMTQYLPIPLTEKITLHLKDPKKKRGVSDSKQEKQPDKKGTLNSE